MSKKYINLKNHTMYSLILGYGDSNKHIQEALEKGHAGVSITDLHTMRGVLDMYSTTLNPDLAKSFDAKDKVPAVFGVDLNIIESPLIKDKKKKYYTITAYAKNANGYKNLCYATSMGTKTENFYSQARTPIDLLIERKEDTVITSGGLNGYIAKAILEENYKIKLFIKEFCEENKIQKIKKSLLNRRNYIKEEVVNKILEDEDLIEFFLILINSEQLQNYFLQNYTFPIKQNLIEELSNLESVDQSLATIPLSEEDKEALRNLKQNKKNHELIKKICNSQVLQDFLFSTERTPKSQITFIKKKDHIELLQKEGLEDKKEIKKFAELLKDHSEHEAIYKISHSKRLENLFEKNDFVEFSDKLKSVKEVSADLPKITLTEDNKKTLIRILSEFNEEEITEKFQQEFKDDFYLELCCLDKSVQWNDEFKAFDNLEVNPQELVNKRKMELSKKYNIKMIMVQDSFMPKKEHYDIQKILIWNSEAGKNNWCMPQPQYLFSVDEMTAMVNQHYPFISNEELDKMMDNSIEILNKCSDFNLSFRPSLPAINYDDHYVNKVPVVIQRSLMLELQDAGVWEEKLKERIKKNRDISSEVTIPERIKNIYNTPEQIIDFEDMKQRDIENKYFEQILLEMESGFKKDEPDFARMIANSKKDSQVRTALKVIMRNKKLVPRELDLDKLDKYIAHKKPGKTHKDFKQEVLDTLAHRFRFFKLKSDPMLLLGDKVRRDRLVEEINIIQYNGILKLITYFMLLEDVSNFHKENGYLYGLGRGSGAGSLFAYGLDITDCDPIYYELLFERFLTKERIGSIFYQLPDYDENKCMIKETDSDKLLELIKSHVNKKKIIDQKWFDDEMFFLECNPNVMRYYLYLKEETKELENTSNSSVLYAMEVVKNAPKKSINASKTELPDIDYDTMARDAVKKYLVHKFGLDYVTLMGTFGKLKTKGAVKEVFKQSMKSMDFAEVNEFTKGFELISALEFKKEEDFFWTHYEKVPEIKELFDKKPRLKTLVVNMLMQLKNVGVHAGGIVVAADVVPEIVPCRFDKKDNMWVTEPDMNHVEWAGLIKYDVLGLNTLNDINKAFRLIERRHGKRLNYENINKFDSLVFKKFTDGDTMSIFQFNKDWIKNYLRKITEVPSEEILKLFQKKLEDLSKKGFTSINDLAIFTSIFRPGPMEMGMHDEFINLIKGLQDIVYLHPSLESILMETYGVMCYQEQVMATVKKIGKFGKNDSVTSMKAMSKKKMKVLKGYKKQFLDEAYSTYPEMKNLVEFVVTIDPKKYLIGNFNDKIKPIDKDTEKFMEEYSISENFLKESIKEFKNRKNNIKKIKDQNLLHKKLEKHGIKKLEDLVKLLTQLNSKKLTEISSDTMSFDNLRDLPLNINQDINDFWTQEKYNNMLNDIIEDIYFKNTIALTEDNEEINIELEMIKTQDKENERNVFLMIQENPEGYKIVFNTIEVTLGEKIWMFLEAFAKYGFNKSHAVAYSTISYICMWLKIHYPIEWKAGVLSGATKDDFKEFYAEWSGDITKPDINQSQLDYIIVKDDDGSEKVLMPFSRIENVADSAAMAIVNTQPYSSFKDFYIRADKRKVNKKTFIHLILSGAFDSLRPDGLPPFEYRKDLCHEYYMLKEKSFKVESDGTVTEGKGKNLNDKDQAERDEFLRSIDKMSRGDFFEKEIELLNLTSVDYIKFYEKVMKRVAFAKWNWNKIPMSPGDVAKAVNKQQVVVGGAIKYIQTLKIKKTTSKDFGKKFLKLRLVNKGEEVTVTIWSRELYDENGNENELFDLQEGWPVMIAGQANYNDWSKEMEVSLQSRGIRVLKNKPEQDDD